MFFLKSLLLTTKPILSDVVSFKNAFHFIKNDPVTIPCHLLSHLLIVFHF